MYEQIKQKFFGLKSIFINFLQRQGAVAGTVAGAVAVVVAVAVAVAGAVAVAVAEVVAVAVTRAGTVAGSRKQDGERSIARVEEIPGTTAGPGPSFPGSGNI